MIQLYNEYLNINIDMEGSITETPKRMNYSTITTNRGMVIQEYSRGVINITIDIKYMTSNNYEDLRTLFLYSDNKFIIEDLDNGSIYKGYGIEGETLSLTKEQDIVNGEYYYKGGLSLCKL